MHYELKLDPMIESRQVIVRQAAQRILESTQGDDAHKNVVPAANKPSPKRNPQSVPMRKRTRP